MKTTFNFYHLLLATSLLLTACSDSNTTSNTAAVVDAATQSEIRELDWMDLMPKGEDDVLEKLSKN